MAQSSSENSIVVFPNAAVESDGNQYWTTSATKAFLAELRQSGLKATLASAVAPYSTSTRYDCLITKGDEVQLFSIGATPSGRFLKFKKTLGYAVSFFRIIFEVPRRPWWYLFLPGHMGLLAGIICCLFRKKFGIYVRCEWPSSGMLGILYSYLFKKATFVFATGEAFTKSLGLFNNHVQQVAPMLPFGLHDIHEKSSYSINDRARILFVGSILPSKGVYDLLTAKRMIADQFDFDLVFAGSSNQKAMERFEKEIQASGCADRVKLTGHVSSKQYLADLYASADIFCLPSHSEGFARVIYEAMGFGLPIVCSDFEKGGGTCFLRNRENCLFAQAKDVADLAARLSEMLDDELFRAKLGNNAFQDALKVYSRFEGVTHGQQTANAIDAAWIE